MKIRNLTLGDNIPKICVSLTGDTRESIIAEAEGLMFRKPDIVEWRFDMANEYDYPIVENILMNLRAILSEIPLIFTFRTTREGGNRNISDEAYIRLYDNIASTGLVDIMDIEGLGNKEMAKAAIRAVKSHGIKTITSYHDFEKTPDSEELKRILGELNELGGDIVKLAVMPKDDEDVKNLINASKDFKEENPDRVFITMSMGEMGSASRLAGFYDGSSVTFAVGVKNSAPGQIKIKYMREYIDILKNNNDKQNIYLIGFMGTGKSAVSKRLSLITGMELIDADSAIVEKANMSINEIFEKYGEEYFRDLETKFLKEISQNKNLIISCGGGMPLREENVSIMKENGVVVLLKAKPETIYERIKDSNDRPKLKGNMNPEYIASLMSQREKAYEGAKTFAVDTDGKSLTEISMEILKNS